MCNYWKQSQGKWGIVQQEDFNEIYDKNTDSSGACQYDNGAIVYLYKQLRKSYKIGLGT